MTAPVIVDTDRRLVRFGDKTARFSKRQFAMIACLSQFPGHVKSRACLLSEADVHVESSDKAIDTQIRRIRRKLREMGCDPIKTVYGEGYFWDPLARVSPEMAAGGGRYSGTGDRVLDHSPISAPVFRTKTAYIGRAAGLAGHVMQRKLMPVLVLLAVTIAGFLSACTPAGTTFFYLDRKSP